MDSQRNGDEPRNQSNEREAPNPQNSTNSTGLNSRSMSEADGLKYPSRDGTYLSQLYSQPLVTTLSSFSHVANLVRNPYELMNNVDEFVRQASGHKQAKAGEGFARSLNQQNKQPSSGPTLSTVQEMDTFVASSLDQSSNSSQQHHDTSSRDQADRQLNESESQLPIPALPPIESSSKRGRLSPLTIEEYEHQLRLNATDLELVERVYLGGISCNQLRAALWPYLFGLIVHRGRFDKVFNQDGQDSFIFVEHEANNQRWFELQRLYHMYQSQWKAIVPDQETRFSTYRERKSLIERDVIRCDRLHQFYAEQPQNLTKLTSLLMTYMMYDFDIGYVQGMSDLAGPILYMYQGDLIKSFWIFVEVMRLFRRNFELTQKTIHFQLSCLYELVKNTDPIFAQYLAENESANCFFAFRAIVCQFKRELMKEDEDDYTKVLYLWDTIWSVKRRNELQEEMKTLMVEDNTIDPDNSGTTGDTDDHPSKPITVQPVVLNNSPFVHPLDPNQADSLRYKLTETEIFVLALCLSMIRRERDLILANKLDATEIHLHFIDPKLSSDLNGFIEHAINIYSYLKIDFDLTKITSPKEQPEKHTELNPESPPGSAEGYDLLSDFDIINGAGS